MHLAWMVLALLVLALGVVQSERLYIPFVNDEIVDYPIVRLHLGKPEKPYRLRVIFNTKMAPVCEMPAFVVLFSSLASLKHKSRTYETIVPQVLGRDIIEAAGWHQWVGVAFAHESSLWVRSSDEQGDAYEGLLCFTNADNVWPIKQALIDRHGIWIDTAAPTQATEPLVKTLGVAAVHAVSLLADETDVDQASNTSDLALALNAAIACGWLNYRSMPTHSHIHRVRLCLTPDLDDALVPNALFSSYFGNLSIYEAQKRDPKSWPPLRFESTTLPRAALVISGQNIMPLNDGVHALDLARLKTNPAAVMGGDTLKLIPHSVDNTTVLIGGHALWSSAIVHLSWTSESSGAATVALYSSLVEYVLTIGHAVTFLLIGILYIRWKLSRQSLDSSRDATSGIRYAYVKRSEIDDLFWPILVPLWLAPLVLVWRWQAIRERIHLDRVLLMVAMAVLSYIVLLITILIVERRKMVKLTREWVIYLKRRIFRHPKWWLSYLMLGEKQEMLQKQTEILPAPVHETQLAYACVRDAAVDVLLSASAWALLGVLESHVFSLPILFASLSILAISSMYTSFTCLFTLLWPVSLSWRIKRRVSKRLQPSLGDVTALMLTLGAAVYIGYLLIAEGMYPLFLELGSPYGSNDGGLAAVAIQLIAAFLFITASAADVTIQSQLPAPPSLERESEKKASKKRQQKDSDI